MPLLAVGQTVIKGSVSDSETQKPVSAAIITILDSENETVAFGIASLWFIQIFINVGMNIGVMPVTGLPLPFISYGGSALLTNLIGAGLLYHIHIHQGQIHYF